MDFAMNTRGAVLVLTVCGVMLAAPSSLLAVSFLEFVDPNPAAGNQFGASVVPLKTGNVVVTSPADDAGGADAGAVYLFNGSTGALISTLLGSTASDAIGNGGVTALSNGNFVIRSFNWDNGAVVNAGAVTWGSGTTGVAGAVSAANSLVGSTASDNVGSTGVTALTNGNYVVASVSWDNGAITGAGAVTWCNGTTGRVGAVSAANSLVGSTASDLVGNSGVTALTNGNYVVASASWDNGAVTNVGAATWCSGTTGRTGAVSATNSLIGSTASDAVASQDVTALTNGNYVVLSPNWDNGAVLSVGAATWCNGTSGRTGAVSAANSLVGSTANDGVGSLGATPLTNGNYVVGTTGWDNGAVTNVGAATWCNGTTGRTGAGSAANSLVGSTTDDQVGSVTALANGNYVVATPGWDNGAIVGAGAVTWGSGTSGVSGAVTVANSLVGSTANDALGSSGVTALVNGNYVVRSPNWDNGAIGGAGAATWGSGTAVFSGVVSAANSLVGSTVSDGVSGTGVTALVNGNYVVRSSNWDNGAVTNVGAATWGNGAIGVSGVISAANSLVGSTVSDLVGLSGVTALVNGNYVVATSNWDNGAAANVGAVTWGSGVTGVTGVVSAANSLVGTLANDLVGGTGVTALSNGNFVVVSSNWDSGALVAAGAVTWCDGTAVVPGFVSAANSLVGTAANTNLSSIVLDDVNDTFIGRFLAEGGGRVRVGAQQNLKIQSAADIPGDQGGWLRLTFIRSLTDLANAPAPVTTYGVWRYVPGTIPAGAGRTSASPDPDADSPVKTLAADLGARQVEGRFYVTGLGAQAAGVAAALPSGTWELVASVPALQRPQYVVAVPTISNANANEFVVTAHTTTPSIWIVSAQASGQSVDNLAPGQPTLLTASYAGDQTNLAWAANTENDLGTYHLYRGTSAGFTPAIGNRIATPLGTSYADVGPPGGYYKLSAVDVNNNESGFALVTPAATTDVVGDDPVAFGLAGARPNPASASGLHISFALPTGAAARLQLLDASGRRVLAREVGSLGAGRHVVNLAEGRTVAPGLYWVRLTQGASQRTTRVAVIE